MILPRALGKTRATLGESPLWDSGGECLYWVDILGETLHSYHPGADIHESIPLGQPVCNVVTHREGGLVLALLDGLYRYRNGALIPLGSPEGYDPAVRFNDGKCDAKGRLFLGSCSPVPGGAALYRWSAADGWRTVLTGVSISNGMAWNADSTVFYYIDTATREVWAFDYDLAAGELARRRTAFALSPGDGVPDGMAIDDDGMLWIAHWGGGKISRWDPEKGAQLEQILLPAPHVTACAFGGADGGTLYVTTARMDLTDSQLDCYPLSGGLFAVEPGVTGPAFYSCQY